MPANQAQTWFECMSSFRPTISAFAAISYSTHAALRLPNTNQSTLVSPSRATRQPIGVDGWKFSAAQSLGFSSYDSKWIWRTSSYGLLEKPIGAVNLVVPRTYVRQNVARILEVDDGHLSIDLFSDPYPNLDEEAATANPSLPPCGQGCFDR